MFHLQSQDAVAIQPAVGRSASLDGTCSFLTIYLSMTRFRATPTEKSTNSDEQPRSLLSFSDLNLKLTNSLNTSLHTVSEAEIFAPSKPPCANCKRTSIYTWFMVSVKPTDTVRNIGALLHICFRVTSKQTRFLPKSELPGVSPKPTQFATMKAEPCKAKEHEPEEPTRELS